jgi:hypothetical protein
MLEGADQLTTAGNWALVVGLVLYVAGMAVLVTASAKRKRLHAHLQDHHPGLWQRLIDGREIAARRYFTLFDWPKTAVRTGDSGVDADFRHLRRLEHASAAIGIPGVLLFVIGTLFADFL